MQHAKITAKGRLTAPFYVAGPRARHLPTPSWGQPSS